MSSSRGIFETFNNQTPENGTGYVPQAGSPFAIAPDQYDQGPSAAPAAKFSPAPERKKPSPFAIVGDNEERQESPAVLIPERRAPAESPFQVAEPQGFGFEAQAQSYGSPLQSAPAPTASPFSAGQPSALPAQAYNQGWPESAPTPSPAPTPHALAAQQPSTQQYYGQNSSESYSIKQLELRAIFGVDREMSIEEIIQRSRSLPGIRQITKVSESDISAVEALKQVISNLGFGNGAIKLYAGSVPIEFIQEGNTLLAVQTDGGFAPGVRETLMLVARELGR